MKFVRVCVCVMCVCMCVVCVGCLCVCDVFGVCMCVWTRSQAKPHTQASALVCLCVCVCYVCVCVCSIIQLCPTLCNSMNHSLPSSSVHGIFPRNNTGADCHFLLQRIFPTQGSNPQLLHLLPWQTDCLPLCPLGSLPEYCGSSNP